MFNRLILTVTGNHQKQIDILISKNQALQIYLKHHDNVYKTPYIIVDKKLTKSTKVLTLGNKQTYMPYSTNCY